MKTYEIVFLSIVAGMYIMIILEAVVEKWEKMK
jgi:hypothetical protein